MDTFEDVWLYKNGYILYQISIIPIINNIPALVQLMARYRSDKKTLSRAMTEYVTDVNMRHSASIS